MSFALEKVEGMHLCDRQDASFLRMLRNGDLCIGRAHDNDLTIDVPTVSAHHAKIYTYLLASYIEDLNSTNGTFVNGKRIKRHVLKPGDVIRLGTYELTLQKPVKEVVETEVPKTAAN